MTSSLPVARALAQFYACCDHGFRQGIGCRVCARYVAFDLKYRPGKFTTEEVARPSTIGTPWYGARYR